MSNDGAPTPLIPRDVRGLRVGVATSRFNGEISTSLTDGAMRVLDDAGVKIDGPHVVAGAFELPLVAQRLAEAGCAAVVALGCIIRGETPHFDVVAAESARGLMDVMLRTSVPIANGILTTDDLAQALARAGDGPHNKGAEAAAAALDAIRALRPIR